MADRAERTGRCDITGALLPVHDLVPLEHLRPAVAQRVRTAFPKLAPTASISRAEADRFRVLYVEELLRDERGELTQLDRDVARSLAEGELLSQNVEEGYRETRTIGEQLSDALANFGGSWTFLIAFGLVLGLWIAVSAAQGDRSFDPYPFILLNLLLSCLAAIQADTSKNLPFLGLP